MRGLSRIIITAIIFGAILTSCTIPNASTVRVFFVTKEGVPIPFVRAELSGISYTADSKGIMILPSNIVDNPLVILDPFVVLDGTKKIELQIPRTRVVCEISEEPFVGMIYKRVENVIGVKLVMIGIPNARAVEVFYTLKGELPEKKQAEFSNNLNNVYGFYYETTSDKILVIDLSERDGLTKNKMFGILDSENYDYIVLEEFEVPLEYCPINIDQVFVVDGEGEELSLKEVIVKTEVTGL
ncbi:hypothetical protein [Mesotoga sp.]|jgi:hypothetical protein|uniref:hypothetical protein n=1 Tax=Mesotoga sp. TaxID=2053577 RepID=UPI000ABEDDD8